MNELLVDLNSDENAFHSSAVLLLIRSIFTKHQKILDTLKLIFFAFSTHIRSSVFTNAGVRDLQVHRPDFCFETNSSTLSSVLAFTFFSC